MSEENPIEIYADEVRRQLSSGHAREHAYRPALKNLLSSFEDALAVNDPKRSEHGNPDFIILKESNQSIIRGYAEAKDITVELDKTAKTEQLRRYAGYNKLFLTNYLDFIFYRNGEEYERISIGKLQGQGIEFNTHEFSRLSNELKAFLELPPEPIKSGKNLALIMGGKAQRIRGSVAHFLEVDSDKNQELEKIYAMMKELLVHDLTKGKFADMYAQTLVYGLFAARYADSTPDNFSRSEARDLVPKSNPFLRKFFDHIAGSDFDVRLAHIVDELCEVFAVSNVHLLVQKHLRLFEIENEKDPIIHFYEDFLKEYDPQERKRMGAYYTPVPVVRFIVRQVNKILKEEFGLTDGLADTSKVTLEIDHGQQLQIRNAKTGKLEKTSIEKREFHKVQVLDPAVGTATFLNETIKHIYETFKGQEGRWQAYVESDLLPRLSGFELMMAPYTIAHLKLGMTLQETGVKDLNQRLGIYLTNTLEEGIPRQQDLFTSIGLAAAVTEESQLASEIKHERPIMVVMGNPPYSGVSSNETKYANSLIDKYKVEPGGQQKLQERKHWLNDDYVKFIAFAEDMINKNGEGIVAMITNNGYLDNPTFRGMRWRLAKTFDKIYVLDLHGNSKKKETMPDGGKDENVFDIQQGVGIILAVKTGEKQASDLAEVFHAEFYGKRRVKFEELTKDAEWKSVTLDHKKLYFVPKDVAGQAEYDKGAKLDELFGFDNIGICTQRDKIAIQRSKKELLDIVRDFEILSDSELRTKYHLEKDGRDWRVATAKEDIVKNGANQKFVREINYRIFDKRWTYYTGKTKGFISYPREKVFSNEREGQNYFLALSRQLAGNEYNHIFISDLAFDQCFISALTKEGQYAFPLYIYHDDGTRTANFKPDVLRQFVKSLNQGYEPEDIFDYIYAVLHSPSYREKYKEFLKIDFPRVPLPANDAEFKRLVSIGRQLRELHLMKSKLLDNYDTTFSESGSSEVDKVKYEDSKVWINDTQYFGNVPEVAWNFYIGGYQPAQKWLKDRKGRKLSSEDLVHYQKIIKILDETDKIMRQIDE